MIPIEPSSDIRFMAANMRQIFLAFVEQGFTENEALTLTNTMISAGMQANGGTK